jgi:branched-chain amino acid transport system substrate-binding protein
MMRISTRHTGLVVFSTFALGLAACGSSSGGSSNGSSGPWTFAVMAPLTGPVATQGNFMKEGVQLGVNQINSQGGIGGQQVQLKFFDDQCSPTQAATVANQIVSDSSITAVIGSVCSAATIAALPIFSRAQLPIVSPNASSVLLTQQVIAHHFTNFARVEPRDDAQGPAMAKLAVTVLGKKNIGVLYGNDDYGTPLYAAARAGVDALGGMVVDAETYTSGKTTDFSPQLTNLASHHPDAIMLVGYYSDVGPAVAQMARAGLSGVTLIGSATVAYNDYITLGGSATDGTLCLVYYNSSNQLPANQTFVTAFNATYHTAPFDEAAHGYVVPFVIQKAVQGGATKATLISVLKGITYDGPTGTIKIDQNGDLIAGANANVVVKVTGGAIVYDATDTSQVNSSS